MCRRTIRKRSLQIIAPEYDLNGLRVLNTRPVESAAALSQAIQHANGISIELPTLRIEPSLTDWLQALPSFDTVQHLLFVSKPAIHYFCTALQLRRMLPLPSHIQITVLGKGSQSALAPFGLEATHLPITPDSEHVLSLPSFQAIQKQVILIVKGKGGRSLLEKTFRKRGAVVYPVEVYRRQLPEKNDAFTTELWQNDEVDIMIFTSEQAMAQLFMLFNPLAHAWIKNKPCLVISDRLAKAAKKLGMKTIFTSRYEDVLKALEGFKHERKS